MCVCTAQKLYTVEYSVQDFNRGEQKKERLRSEQLVSFLIYTEPVSLSLNRASIHVCYFAS